MPWKEPAERHNDDLIEAIGHAAHRISTAIKEGFQLMADTEAQALADLQSAITGIGTAIAAEVVALQAAMNAQGVNNSPAIEASVQKIKDMTAVLNNSLAAPVPPPPPALPEVASLSPTSGPAAGGTLVTITGANFTGATQVTFSSIPAASFSVKNDTTLTAVTPAAVVGASLPVVVTTPAGPSAVGPTWSFT